MLALLGHWRGAVALSLAAWAVLGAAYFLGRHHGAQAGAEAALQAYVDTIEAIENADVPTDPGEVRRRLCELAGVTPCHP